MRINLTKEEAEYLQDAPFWDWKRAEIDVWAVKLHPEADRKPFEEKEKFYRDLYHKLGGEI